MRMVLLTSAICWLVLGCGRQDECDDADAVAFEEDKILLADGVVLKDLSYIEDGGTVCAVLLDREGRECVFFISKRMGRKQEHGSVYANEYMGRPGSVLLRDQQGIRALLHKVGVPLVPLGRVPK